MSAVSNDKKSSMKKEWGLSQQPIYILTKEQVESLFAFLDDALDESPCDHTMRQTAKWINQNCPDDKKEAIFDEIQDMGGYCDCEVLLNCYEEYDIE